MRIRSRNLSSLLVFALVCLTFCHPAAADQRAAIAITFDDLPLTTALRDPIERQEKITERLVTELKSRDVPVIGFVNGNKLIHEDRIDPRRVALLETWLDAGFELGSHTFSHPDLHRIEAAAFEQDIVNGEETVSDLLRRRGQRMRYFRHPFLHTGTSPEVRSRIESFLSRRGYVVAPVTIDNSEWIFARAFDLAVAAGDAATETRLVDEYLRYMISKVAWYEGQSEKLFGRQIRQILLVHANALNARAFDRLVDALGARGNRFIELDRALNDPAYASPDGYYGPEGISWLDRWALTRGVPEGFFADEPRTAAWVLEYAGIDSE